MKTLEEIYQNMLAQFTKVTGVAPGESGDLAVRLYAVAAQIYALYVQVDWVNRQCFPQTAAGEFLDSHAQLRGLSRREAVKAVGSLTFSAPAAVTAALTVPEGTVCMTPGLVRFETTQAGVVAVGQTSVTIPAQAAEAGAVGNAAAGSILNMAVAPLGVSACVNQADFTGGLDREEDKDLRVRVLESFRRLPNGANAAFYQQGALSFPEVAAAAVLPRARGKGTVDVVVATSAGVPTAALLSQLKEYFAQRREIAVDVDVKGPANVTVNLKAAVRPAAGYTFAQAKAAAERAIRSWFDGRLLGQNVLRAKLGSLLYGAEGVDNYTLTAPAADVSVTAGQLPVLGSVTITQLEAEA